MFHIQFTVRWTYYSLFYFLYIAVTEKLDFNLKSINRPALGGLPSKMAARLQLARSRSFDFAVGRHLCYYMIHSYIK